MGKLYPMEIKKTATPDIRLTKVFNVIDKSSLQRGTSAILCTAERLGAFDKGQFNCSDLDDIAFERIRKSKKASPEESNKGEKIALTPIGGTDRILFQ